MHPQILPSVRLRAGAFVCLVLLLFILESGQAEMAVVVPNDLATVEGNTYLGSPFHLTPFGASDSLRYQQIYAADQFAAWTGPVWINAVSFRPDAVEGQAYGPTIFSDIEIKLSTTSTAPGDISLIFADNIGADETVVFSGDLTLSSQNTLTAYGTKVFDITLHFTTPFLYDPSAGNLLIDLINPYDTTETYWDFQSDAMVTGCIYGDYDAADAYSRYAGSGLVTRFVPEPATFALLALGALLIRGRRL